MDGFNSDEINILIEAVGAWPNRDLASNLMTTVLTGLLASDDEETMSEWKAEREDESAKLTAQKKMDEERAIIIKAKLLAIRDKVEASEVSAEA